MESKVQPEEKPMGSEIDELKETLKDVVVEEHKKEDKPLSEKAYMLYLALKALSAMRLTKEDAQPAEIIPGLFLGSVGAAFCKESLQKNGITHILTCADKLKPRFPEEYQYLCLPVLDSPTDNIVRHFSSANAFIQSALAASSPRGKVLVHCFAGKSRSTSFVLAYLMCHEKIALKEGLELVRAKRTIAEPNPGFVIQLKAYEASLFGKVSNVPNFLNKDQEKKEGAKMEANLEGLKHSLEEMGLQKQPDS